MLFSLFCFFIPAIRFYTVDRFKKYDKSYLKSLTCVRQILQALVSEVQMI